MTAKSQTETTESPEVEPEANPQIAVLRDFKPEPGLQISPEVTAQLLKLRARRDMHLLEEVAAKSKLTQVRKNLEDVEQQAFNLIGSEDPSGTLWHDDQPPENVGADAA